MKIPNLLGVFCFLLSFGSCSVAYGFVDNSIPASSPVESRTAQDLMAEQVNPVPFNSQQVRYQDRTRWRTHLNWSDDCEDSYQTTAADRAQDWGGIDFYPLAERKYLAMVHCQRGPYWVRKELYIYDARRKLPKVKPLMVKTVECRQDNDSQPIVHLSADLYGIPHFDPATKTLLNFHRSGAVEAYEHTYTLENDELVLQDVICKTAYPSLKILRVYSTTNRQKIWNFVDQSVLRCQAGPLPQPCEQQ